jgi:Ca2+-binding EF-hand superfamily protein
VLASHPDFVLLNVFNQLCTSAKAIGANTDNHQSSITTLDLVGFFKLNGHIISERDCYLMITQYDTNKDGKLSFSE